MADWRSKEAKYYMKVVNRQSIVIVKGEGTRVWDDEGKDYLDFTAGWAVNNIGHANPAITAAIQAQAGQLLQTSNQFFTIPQLELAELLVENSCMEKVFFCNSGAEANEGAIKLIRKWGKINKNGPGEIITAYKSFHGRTMNMVAATAQPKYQEAWAPIPTGFTHVDFDDITQIKNATNENTVAVMLEPVQSEGGVNIPSSDYLSNVRSWCDENNLLLIFDEVSTGLGRLGELFGYQLFDVEPDVLTLAKGLGGGVPIGAFLCNQRANVLEPGDHGSTFGGNALTCAASEASTRFIIEEDVPGNSRNVGKYMKDQLENLRMKHEIISDVRGIGCLVGVEFSADIAGKLLSACNDNGLLLNVTATNIVRWMPPLTVTKEEVDEAIEKFDKALDIAKV
ncbi:MAG: aspartate aminotransferase family protein [SAR202 cluster bacterium]|nr:aspartate aminotransferase family protein [SAR202 cluster bacterium]|tara:strand:- start:808 stop:1995 length:1188 start_codon:yes stop_codon:yes gene_type:complete